MWWSRAVLVLSLLALGPMGCGFSPLYTKGGGQADSSPVSADLAAIRIQPIKDRLGQQFRNALVSRLTPRGEPGDYAYVLSVDLTSTPSDLGYRRDSFATLGLLTMTASFQLTGNGIAITGGTASTTVYFDYLGPRYASVAMERDAEERAITQLSEDVRSQVAVSIARYKANPKDPKYRQINQQGDAIRPLERP